MADEALLLESLTPFFKNEYITAVRHVVKSGKEAIVYCCQAHPSTGVDLLAAKIYLPRENRTFSNDALYQEGRFVDKRIRKAVLARSRKGLAAIRASWIDHEYATLHLLYHAGCDVPRPWEQVGDAMLMEYIGDRQAAAPTLARTRIEPREAQPLFRRLLHNIEILLAHDRVHGDLSPYNILYWRGAITIIDFPQAVHPQINDNAYDLLMRDVENVCAYFARYGVRSQPRRIADDLWLRYQFGEL